jgi:hypothetical protein
MGYNKFVYDGVTKFDLTGDTVTPQTLAKGVTAHNAKGDPIVGTLVPEGGSGGGIIDVTELPTENIDENAVYRVTESIQTEKTEIYILASGVVTIQQYLTSLGVPTKANMYVVDELPADMLPTDIQTFTQLHFYILKSNGVAYAYVPAMGGVITGGLFGFQDMGYDKGFTENIYNESDAGIYTTIETYKQIIRWFIRKNGEWKEITAYIKLLTSHGFTDIEMLSGDITPRISAAAEIVTCEVTEIREDWFRKKDGTYHEYLGAYLFSNNQLLINATIPSCVRFVELNSFFNCLNLTTVTFKERANQISETAFSSCNNLTTINVPWSENKVENAPWGATNATINYNYTEG